MKNKRFFWAMLSLAFLLINLSACGGGGGDASGIGSSDGSNGSVLTTTVGSNGGQITSSDGIAKVEFITGSTRAVEL